jgi:hypothetical protein
MLVAFGLLAGSAVAMWLSGFRQGYMSPLVSDLWSYFIPKYQYAAAHLADGVWPTWNPYEFFGLPFLATLQPAVLYPPVVLIHLLADSEAAIVALQALHLGLGAMGCILLARSLGLSRYPSILAAGWTILPMWLMRSYEHPIYAAGVAWIPFLLLLARRIVQQPSLRASGLFGAVAALQALSGYPPFSIATAYVLLLALGAWCVERHGEWSERAVRRVAAALAVGASIAVLLTSVQLWPTAELVQSSDREALSQRWSQEVEQVVSGAWRSALGFPEPTVREAAIDVWHEFGPALLLLAGIGLFAARPRPVVFFVGTFFLWSALVPFEVIRRLPFYEFVRFGQEWTFIAPIPLYLLAGFGLQRIMGPRPIGARLAALAVLAVFAATAAWNLRREMEVGYHDAALPRAALAPAILEACDLTQLRYRLYWPQEQGKSTLLTRRIASPGGVEQSLPPARSIRLSRAVGIDSYLPADWQRGFASHRELLRRMSVRCFLAPMPSATVARAAGFRPVRVEGSGDLLYRSDHALARFRITTAAHYVADAEAAFAAVTSETLPAEVVVLEGQPTSRENPCDDRDAVLRVAEVGEARLRFVSDSPCSGWLVVSDTWDEGWRATVDGRRVPILRADYAFRAVALDGGRHEIVMDYEPRSLSYGWRLSCVGGLGLLVAVALPRRLDPLAEPRFRARTP